MMKAADERAAGTERPGWTPAIWVPALLLIVAIVLGLVATIGA